jgi:putative tricarboxylic transport membrane protein
MINGFYTVFNPLCIGMMFAGTTLGAIFGAIPGLSGSIAIAIFLPLTYYTDTIPALTLLVSIYVGGSFGGSIPAILIGTPGAPEAGITVLDGTPMAKKGLSGKALKTSLYASCAGFYQLDTTNRVHNLDRKIRG